MRHQQHRYEVFPTGSLMSFIGTAGPRGSFALGLPAARHPDEAAPLSGVEGAKQPHRRLALNYARRASPAQCLA
jgi:hypothetical protein